ncbi:F-box protein At4g00893-like [Corylus avellana]|uniref:F-box protein At4g00893-like n=1 Tax=Corylus avellana TaxID=13451 RepID=UPI001E1FB829|nr:F-box protein At4g00893-like [Corylus avellana]
MENRNWSDLPLELLATIAESLGIIELLSFRSVCKDWSSASATASAQIESSKEAWFLVYGESPTCECLLVSNSGEKHSIHIPDLIGSSTTCLASTHGWLLLFQNGGSIFFFCPFSRAKIHLPKLPFSEITDHVATFSSPPTSENCVVAVISRSSESEELEVNMLQRGADAWTNHKTSCPLAALGAVKGAAFYEGCFSFFDSVDKLVRFYVESQDWGFFRLAVAPREKRPPEANGLEFIPRRKQFVSLGMDKRLGLSEDVSISTCGTQVSFCNVDEVLFCETIDAAESSKTSHLKGVWIQPRFFQVSPTQSW